MWPQECLGLLELRMGQSRECQPVLALLSHVMSPRTFLSLHRVSLYPLGPEPWLVLGLLHLLAELEIPWGCRQGVLGPALSLSSCPLPSVAPVFRLSIRSKGIDRFSLLFINT